MDSFYMPSCSNYVEMADGEDIQPLVCDNGTGMVKVSAFPPLLYKHYLPCLFPNMPLIMALFIGWFCW